MSMLPLGLLVKQPPRRADRSSLRRRSFVTRGAASSPLERRPSRPMWTTFLRCSSQPLPRAPATVFLTSQADPGRQLGLFMGVSGTRCVGGTGNPSLPDGKPPSESIGRIGENVWHFVAAVLPVAARRRRCDWLIPLRFPNLREDHPQVAGTSGQALLPLPTQPQERQAFPGDSAR